MTSKPGVPAANPAVAAANLGLTAASPGDAAAKLGLTAGSPGDATASDPGEDWARAIAEMTANGTDVADNPDGVRGNDLGVTADGAVVPADGAVVPADGEVATGARIDAEADPEASGTPAAPPGPAAARRPRMALAAVLGAATIVIGSLGIWAAVAANGLRASSANANLAFTDPAATRAVDQQVAAAVNTIFSYSYADSARTRTAAQSLLTGAAIREYNQLFAIVEREAPKEKLTVTTRVTNIGVELLTGARARVLVFANQQDSAAGTGKTSYGGAMFAVTAVNQHGKWRIESIDTFTGPA